MSELLRGLETLALAVLVWHVVVTLVDVAASRRPVE
jgi:hypothetical protein